MWKKRQDQWDAEAEARRRLMEEVDLTRKAQMRGRVETEAEERARAAEEARVRARVWSGLAMLGILCGPCLTVPTILRMLVVEPILVWVCKRQ